MRSSRRCAPVLMNNLVNWLVERKVSGLLCALCDHLLLRADVAISTISSGKLIPLTNVKF